MLHEMRLNPTYYDYIVKGTKRIEIRLYDEKRQKIKVGDTIKFSKLDNEDVFFLAKVMDLYIYDDIDDLLKNFDISILLDSSFSKNDLKDIFNSIYSKEEQNKYKVIGIKIKPIK